MTIAGAIKTGAWIDQLPDGNTASPPLEPFSHCPWDGRAVCCGDGYPLRLWNNRGQRTAFTIPAERVAFGKIRVGKLDRGQSRQRGAISPPSAFPDGRSRRLHPCADRLDPILRDDDTIRGRGVVLLARKRHRLKS